MSTRTRTDQHRPGSPDFDPARYTVLGVFVVRGRAAGPSRATAVADALAAGHVFAPHQRNACCGHCGVAITYGALLLHDTGEMIWVGETCLDGRFAGTRADFDRLRAQTKAEREQQKRAGVLAGNLEDAVARNWVLEVLGNPQAMATELVGSLPFATDVRDRMDRWPLTDKQVEALAGAITRDREAQVLAATAAPVVDVPVPEGSGRVSGTVTKMVMKPGYAGTSVPQMTVRDERGFMVSGTAPAALLRMVDDDMMRLRGEFVEFEAVLTRGKSRESWGWFKSPRKPVLVVVAG